MLIVVFGPILKETMVSGWRRYKTFPNLSFLSLFLLPPSIVAIANFLTFLVIELKLESKAIFVISWHIVCHLVCHKGTRSNQEGKQISFWWIYGKVTKCAQCVIVLPNGTNMFVCVCVCECVWQHSFVQFHTHQTPFMTKRNF